MYKYESNELELVFKCPICSSVNYEPEHFNVPDILSTNSPGLWSYVKCLDCESRYLNIRPREQYIYKAYQSYYTHYIGGIKHFIKRFFILSYIKSFVLPRKVSYFNKIFHFLFFLPMLDWFDSKTRHLRIIGCNQIEDLLDVGCGNGDFLELVRSANIDCVGCDFDSVAIKRARDRGLIVSQDSPINIVSKKGSNFSLITASHVLEHLYDPHSFFLECNISLKSKGFLWLQVPNSQSNGLSLFGKYWRGLEAPRHISIPSLKGLMILAQANNFEVYATPIVKSSAIYMGFSSIKAHIKFFKNARLAGDDEKVYMIILRSIKFFYLSLNPKKHQEFITIIFRKIS